MKMKSALIEVWAFIAVFVIAFVGGLVVGDLGSPTKTETIRVTATAAEGEAAAGGEEAPASEPEGGTAKAGAQIFASAGCGSCHTLSAAGSTGEVGPNLNESLAPDDNTAGIEEMILHPNEEVVEGYPPNLMPKTYGQTLSEEEVHQLAEFLVASTAAKP